MKPARWLLAAAAIAAAFLAIAPAIPQDPRYHAFADSRGFFGIPRFWDVISNAPFALVGWLGLRVARKPAEWLLWTGVFLTALGSAYYHLDPSDARLVWDRLPMTLVFMPLTAIAAGLWAGAAWERRLLIPLTAFGIASVIWWSYSGDLRFYALAQFGPILVLLPAAIQSARVRGLWLAALAYVFAKLAEAYDRQIFAVLPLSGHTWKHFLSALATYWIYRWNSTFSATDTPKPSRTPAGMPAAH